MLIGKYCIVDPPYLREIEALLLEDSVLGSSSSCQQLIIRVIHKGPKGLEEGQILIFQESQ